MTKPSDRLYLSYATSSSDGKSLRPSGLIGQVLKMFPEKRVMRADEKQMVAWSLPLGKRRVIEGLKDYGSSRQDSRFMELFGFLRSELYRDELKGDLLEASFYTYEDRGIGRTAAKGDIQCNPSRRRYEDGTVRLLCLCPFSGLWPRTVGTAGL